MIAGANNKRTKHVETGFDSEDNEPIGSIFKLRKPRGAKKKASFALEGTGGGGGKNVDSIGKNSVAAQEDLGSTDDTLASFRKRLKGPKRGAGIWSCKREGFCSECGGGVLECFLPGCRFG